VNLEGLTEKRRGKKSLWYENAEGKIVAKACTKCGEVKTLEDYTKDKKGLAGKAPNCKVCQKEYNEANKDRSRQHYADNREKYIETSLKWAKENPERSAQNNRIWQRNNPERVAIHTREWTRNNSEKNTLKAQRYLARKASLPDTLTSEQYTITLEYFGNACALTGRIDSIEVEHALPISVGHGGTTFENCYPMATGLNQSKGNKNIFEWFEANRQRFNLEQERFDRLIEWLGKANGMTVEEYCEYVYECHANLNEINDAKAI
jgi:hypothetical protein